MTIRRMEARDLPACAEILCAVYNNELWMCRWTQERAAAYLLDYFEHRRFVGFVAEADGEVIGGLFAHEKTWWNNDELFIDEMFVRPACQGRGIGTQLLDRAGAHVREQGLAGITLTTNRFAPAPKFYAANGFAPCEHVMFMARE